MMLTRTVVVASVTCLFILNALAAEGSPPDASFNSLNPSAKMLLVIVGGNSECKGDKGLWPIRELIAHDIETAVGVRRSEMSTLYFSWTGDPGGHTGCLPGPKRLEGDRKILEALQSNGTLNGDRRIVVVGWSNGGATAVQLSNLMSRAANKQVDLLVTLDPVSVLTQRPDVSGASVWLDVYTRSPVSQKFEAGNIIALVGGAWNEIVGPQLVVCMAGNHGETKKMWTSVVVESTQLEAWARATNHRLHLSQAPTTLRKGRPAELCR